MQDTIAGQLDLSHLRLGEAATVAALEVYPLILEGNGHAPGYLMLDEALARGQVEVTEVGGGSVPELLVTNRADLPVLLVEGGQLVGAKQNRVLNISLLVPARSTQPVPVSCVERGRWHYAQADRRSQASDSHLFQRARRAKTRAVVENLRSGQSARSDQGELWRMVDEKAEAMAAPSPTGAMEAIYVKHHLSLEETLEPLRPVSGQVGALVACGGRVEGLDAFDHPTTWGTLWRKILRGYLIDALERTEHPARFGRERAEDFLRQLAGAQLEPAQVAGVGEHLLLRSPSAAGFALRYQQRLVHLFAYAGPDGGW